MPVVFDEITADVVPDRAARAEEPPAEPEGPQEPEPRALRRELRRLAIRAARLRAE